ncbi:MAG: glycine--tRNA ligase subunit beta [Deltaproteobacteria bacterium RBG_19FT_COMBO_46_12]|nr:MAG: glycine--tRNA ligase subunit beta [Deltaproteobacteria bacterium RBG_19FT_COMBO_46_12]
MKELLFEIGTEEIPAGFIPQALMDLESLAKKELEASRIDFNGIKTLGTPRRFVLVIESVSEKQKDEETRKVGPSKQAAFDGKGNPTKAAIGFAKSQSVPVESLTLVQTDKGEYVSAIKKEVGRSTLEILSFLLPKWVLSIPFQKSMRWADVSIRFARPIHWILALFGGEVVPFEVGNIQSGNKTYGHRFMHAGPIPINDVQSYLQKTREAFVMVDPVERKKKIEEGMIREGARVSGKILKDEELLDEVNFLVEYPVALCGTFDNKFLSLPREILVHSMKEHQRYFPLVDDHGVLLPHFVCISNIHPKNREVVVKGNEKVLRARLSDAAFFFEDDLKISLDQRVEQLKKVVFQAKLGTSYEKVMRFKGLALWMTERIDPTLRELVARTSLLCKADLVTGMVGEFPKLQGIVGREYARLSKEKPEVAEAIYEHYLPGFAGDRLPSSPIGDIVSIADKMDTVVGCFGVGLVPTGTADPFGLRRQALGIIRIVLEKKYPISLRGLIEESQRQLKEKMERPVEQVKEEVLDFFRVRYQNFLLDKGCPFDVTEAVLSISFDELLDVQGRLDALRKAREWEDFESIVVAFKRAMNILKGAPPKREIHLSLLSEPVEQNLYQSFLKVRERIDNHLNKRDYLSALLEMTHMKKPIDDFFDGVMVMIEDEAVRDNRLALLDEIGKLFLKIADFSKLT